MDKPQKAIFHGLAVLALALGLLPGLSACSEDVPPSTASALPPGEPFLMRVADAFEIHGQGMVLTGFVDSGTVRVGDSACLRGEGADPRALTVKSIETLRGVTDTASAGDRPAIIVEGLRKADLPRGSVLTLTAACE